MAFIIDSEICISCGSCAAVCPCEAISEGVLSFEIDPEICVECGTCEPICPLEAISIANESTNRLPNQDGKFILNRPMDSKGDKFKKG